MWAHTHQTCFWLSRATCDSPNSIEPGRSPCRKCILQGSCSVCQPRATLQAFLRHGTIFPASYAPLPLDSTNINRQLDCWTLPATSPHANNYSQNPTVNVYINICRLVLFRLHSALWALVCKGQRQVVRWEEGGRLAFCLFCRSKARLSRGARPNKRTERPSARVCHGVPRGENCSSHPAQSTAPRTCHPQIKQGWWSESWN